MRRVIGTHLETIGNDLAEWRNGSASDSSMLEYNVLQGSLQKVIRSNRVSVNFFGGLWRSIFFLGPSTTHVDRRNFVAAL